MTKASHQHTRHKARMEKKKKKKKRKKKKKDTYSENKH